MTRGTSHGGRVLSMAGGTAASRLTGLLRVLVLAWVLGFTPLADAFNLANTIPNMLFDLVIGTVGWLTRPESRTGTVNLAMSFFRPTRGDRVVVEGRLSIVVGSNSVRLHFEGRSSFISNPPTEHHLRNHSKRHRLYFVHINFFANL